MADYEMAKRHKIEGKPKIHVEMICIVVDELISTKEKPYFALLYKEVGAKDYNIGYASYNLDVVVEYKNKYFEKVQYVGGIYGRNDFKYFVLYGIMCTFVRMCIGNCTYTNSIKCICTDVNQDNKRRTKEKVKLGVAFATLLCYYISVNKVCNR